MGRADRGLRMMMRRGRIMIAGPPLPSGRNPVDLDFRMFAEQSQTQSTEHLLVASENRTRRRKTQKQMSLILDSRS